MPYEISSHASSTSLSTAPYLQRAYYISRKEENQEFLPEDYSVEYELIETFSDSILHCKAHHVKLVADATNGEEGQNATDQGYPQAVRDR